VLEFRQDQGITIENLTVTGGDDSGIICDDASPSLMNVTVSGNEGSGIDCTSSHPTLMNVTVSGNEGSGIHCSRSHPTLVNVTVSGNTAWGGGGIYCYDSSPSLSNVTVSGNTAQEGGGGIYCYDSSPSFDLTDRCNIYLNQAPSGRDLYASETLPTIHVVVDTFTVMNPTDDLAYPLDNFTFDILHAKEGPIGTESSELLPTEFALHQNYPNPFNPVSTIRYELPQASNVSLLIYDILGREVARLVDSYMEPGYQHAQWNGRDATGHEVPSGIYIARLVTPEYSQSIKMVLLK
jgi:predicted outer membrane repeat protein